MPAKSTDTPVPATPATPDVQTTLAAALKAAGIRAEIVRSSGVHDDAYTITVHKD